MGSIGRDAPNRQGRTGTHRGIRNQVRAARFRTRNETIRTIKLVDEFGNRKYVRQYGKMGVTKHQRVLSVLEKRALRYRERGGSTRQQPTPDYTIDETGTVDTAGLTDSDSDGDLLSVDSNKVGQSTEQQELEEIQGVADELLRVHGTAPGCKGEGITRLLYENAHGLNSRIGGNEKLDKAKELIDDLEADLVAYSKHR